MIWWLVGIILFITAIMLWLRSVVDEITSEPGEWFNW